MNRKIERACKTTFVRYTRDDKIQIRGPGIIFRNQGTNTVTINGSLVLTSGQSVEMPQMSMALEDRTLEYSISFGESGTKNLCIIERTYL